jgi:intein-encoded DNA endonuclease-like protein
MVERINDLRKNNTSYASIKQRIEDEFKINLSETTIRRYIDSSPKLPNGSVCKILFNFYRDNIIKHPIAKLYNFRAK